MNEEELRRIERGDPDPIGENVAALIFMLCLLGLLVFIIWGVLL